jgi:hypothetical protein
MINEKSTFLLSYEIEKLNIKKEQYIIYCLFIYNKKKILKKIRTIEKIKGDNLNVLVECFNTKIKFTTETKNVFIF